MRRTRTDAARADVPLHGGTRSRTPRATWLVAEEGYASRMRWWKVGVAALAIATSFTVTWGASAGLLQHPPDEAQASVPTSTALLVPPGPSPLLIPSPSAEPQLPFVHRSRRRQNEGDDAYRRQIEVADPWSSSHGGEAPLRPLHRSPRSLDRTNPWGNDGERVAETDHGSPPVTEIAPPLPRRRLDATDPWTPVMTVPMAPTAITVPTPGLADDALREAIKRSLDAGDLERAAKLLEILRSSH